VHAIIHFDRRENWPIGWEENGQGTKGLVLTHFYPILLLFPRYFIYSIISRKIQADECKENIANGSSNNK
jgi:hypothetical protein